MKPRRYSARLVARIEETDGRWHAGRDNLDVLCRLAVERRQPGEIAIVTDHETGEAWLIGPDGQRTAA
jgi:hypothetical protein